MPSSAPRPPKDDTATSSGLSTVPLRAPMHERQVRGHWHQGPTRSLQHCVRTHEGAQDPRGETLPARRWSPPPSHSTRRLSEPHRHTILPLLTSLPWHFWDPGPTVASDGIGSSSLRPVSSIPTCVLANRRGRSFAQDEGTARHSLGCNTHSLSRQRTLKTRESSNTGYSPPRALSLPRRELRGRSHRPSRPNEGSTSLRGVPSRQGGYLTGGVFVTSSSNSFQRNKIITLLISFI